MFYLLNGLKVFCYCYDNFTITTNLSSIQGNLHIAIIISEVKMEFRLNAMEISLKRFWAIAFMKGTKEKALNRVGLSKEVNKKFINFPVVNNRVALARLMMKKMFCCFGR